jgi:hypothetical protein
MLIASKAGSKDTRSASGTRRGLVLVPGLIKGPWTFVFKGSPTVLSVSPTTVEADGGTAVILTGVNLATVSACRFGEYGSRSRVSVVNSERVVCAAPRLPVRSPMEGGNVALFLSTGGSYVDSGIAVTYSSMKTGATLYAETLVDPTASDGERPVSWE